MIGGEAAEWAALECRTERADGRDPYGLGWVTDWLYGDAVLPPTPLPPEPEPALHWRRPPVPQHASPPAPRESRRNRRRARQLVLF